MIKYVFRDGNAFGIKNAKDANPQVIGQSLALISKKHNGRLTPDMVVAAAKSSHSPLHRHFEWDNTIAADAYRLGQARDLVQSIHVEDTKAEVPVARAFLSIIDPEQGRSYRTLSDVISSADLQMKVLEEAQRDLLAFERRYRALEDICDLVRSIREKLAKRIKTRDSKHENRAAH